jgi:hypothetical protein
MRRRPRTGHSGQIVSAPRSVPRDTYRHHGSSPRGTTASELLRPSDTSVFSGFSTTTTIIHLPTSYRLQTQKKIPANRSPWVAFTGYPGPRNADTSLPSGPFDPLTFSPRRFQILLGAKWSIQIRLDVWVPARWKSHEPMREASRNTARGSHLACRTISLSFKWCWAQFVSRREAQLARTRPWSQTPKISRHK